MFFLRIDNPGTWMSLWFGGTRYTLGKIFGIVLIEMALSGVKPISECTGKSWFSGNAVGPRSFSGLLRIALVSLKAVMIPSSGNRIQIRVSVEEVNMVRASDKIRITFSTRKVFWRDFFLMDFPRHFDL